VALRIGIATLILTVSFLFLFARLGHHSFWGDEALTALPALNLWRTGDTLLRFGTNIMAERDGAGLVGYYDASGTVEYYHRTTQPLMFYIIIAPSLGLLGASSWAGRLPFAICGLGCVALILHWLWREKASALTWFLMALGLLGNASFFLYSRQCRYYGLGFLLTVAIAYCYRFFDGRRRSVAVLAFLLLALVATQMLLYVAVSGALLVDYAIWGRKRHPLSAMDWLWLALPQVLLGGPLLAVWNPWRSGRADPVAVLESAWVAKPTLLYRNLRDLNRCEFGVLPLIALSPLLYRRYRCEWLLRAPLALLVYIVVETAVSPQPIANTTRADVRYLSPIIPLFIATEVLVLSWIAVDARYLALALGLVAFGTNILHVEPLFTEGFRSTVCDFSTELLRPRADPNTMAAQWINGHVEPGQSVLVLPAGMTYSLMFHAPGAVYAWQLPTDSEHRFPDLDAIHFQRKVAPDYMIAFGPTVESVRAIRPSAGFRYEEIARLDVYWRELIRPELFWRTFRPITDYDEDREVVFIFRKA
jgi:hypothetical protein